MKRAEEFEIEIDADGRVIFNIGGTTETSLRRIMEYLEETVGPTQPLELEPGDPPTERILPVTEEDTEKRLRMDKRGT